MLVLKPVLRPQVDLLLEVLYFDMVGQLLGYLLCGKLIHDRYYLKRFLFLLVAGKDAVIRRLELVSRHPLLFLSRLLQVFEELLQLLRTVQTGGSVVEQLPPVLLVHYLHFVRGKEDVSHVESVYQVSLLDRFALLQQAIDDGHWSHQKLFVLLVRNDANNGEGILKRFGEHISEEVNSMGENIGVLTNEYYLIFEHHQGPNIEKTLESKHAEDGINPLPSEECFTFVPVAHKGQFLLVYQSELILFIEVHFLELEILMAVIEKLDHSLHLELTVSLLYGQFYVLFIVLIYCQPFHLYDIDEVPEYLLKEGEEGVVRHYTKYPLRDAHVEVIDIVQCLIDRFE